MRRSSFSLLLAATLMLLGVQSASAQWYDPTDWFDDDTSYDNNYDDNDGDFYDEDYVDSDDDFFSDDDDNYDNNDRSNRDDDNTWRYETRRDSRNNERYVYRGDNNDAWRYTTDREYDGYDDDFWYDGNSMYDFDDWGYDFTSDDEWW